MTPTTPSPISDQAAGEPIAWLIRWPNGNEEVFMDLEIAKQQAAMFRTKPVPLGALSTAPSTGSAPNERDFEAYRRGVREAFHVANICNVTRHDRTPEETCSYIVRSLARLANGGEEPIVPPASPAASVPMVIARLKESLRAKSSTALTVTCWRADLIALLAASMGGDRT